MNISQLDSLVDEFTKKATAHGDAMRMGDDDVANKLHADLMRLLDSVGTSGTEGAAKLMELLEHSETSVRLWAATQVLRENESKAIATLQSISDAGGISSLNARSVLDLWKKGMLK